MTRFFVTKNCEEAISSLCSLLDKHHYTWNVDAAGAVCNMTLHFVYTSKLQFAFR